MSSDLLSLKVADVMTKSPKTIDAQALTSEALEMLNAASITCIFVTDKTGAPTGLIHVHDLLRIGVT
jgi:arabinose-5-phosphate isomerase